MSASNSEVVLRIKRLFALNAGLLVLVASVLYLGVIGSAEKGSAPYRFQTGLIRLINGALTGESAYQKGIQLIGANQSDAAIKWLKFAHQDSYEKAAFELGKLHLRRGGEANTSKGLEYLIESGQKGNGAAYLEVGKLFYGGAEGIPRDYQEAGKFYLLAANANVAEAQGLVSSMYAYGIGLPLDYLEAFSWATKGAEADDGLASANLGLLLFYGYGTTTNEERGLQLLNKAEKKNIPVALLALSRVHSTTGAYFDADKARLYIKKAADLNEPQSLEELGTMHAEGRIVEQNAQKAVDLFMRSAKLGYPPAQRKLGWAYLRGYQVAADANEGLRWMTAAANNRDAEAQYSLGSFFWHGNYLTKDFDAAVKWIRPSAQGGFKKAYYLLGVANFNGIGAPRNRDEGLKWLRLAAESGDSAAQGYLAYIYYVGDGIAIDKAEAFKWSELAKSDANSILIRGLVFIEGANGIVRDEKKGIELVLQAAQLGQAYAAKLSGDFYKNSPNVKSDPIASLAWYIVAATRGYDGLQPRITTASEQLGPAGATNAKTLAEKMIQEINVRRQSLGMSL
jgi:TPR repeat protein